MTSRLAPLLAIALLGLVSPAKAAAPTVTTNAAAAYDQALVGTTWAAARTRLELLAAGWQFDPEAIAARSANAKAVFATARADALARAAVPGDPGLKDAVLHALDEADWLAGDGILALAPLIDQRPPTAAGQAELETAWASWAQRRSDAIAAVDTAEQLFATKYGVTPAPTPALPAGAALYLPELVPGGSVVPVNVHGHLVASYRAYTVEQQATLVQGYGKLASTVQRLETARLELRATVVEVAANVAALEPFRGDASVKDKLTLEAAELLAVIDGDLASCAALAGKEKLTKKEVDAANALLERINFTMQSVFTRAERAQPAFDVRWKIEAYQRWASQEPALVRQPNLMK